MGLSAFPHEAYPNFFWKRVRYDPDNNKFITYECGSCCSEVEAPETLLSDELAKHELNCEANRIL